MSSITINNTSIKKRLKKRLRRPYYIYREVKKLRADRKHLWKDAVEQFRLEKPRNGSLADYKTALRRHRVSYDEYMKCYEFWNLDEKKRSEFVSELEMRCIYRKTVQVEFDQLCSNKMLLLNAFKKYVHRDWTFVGSISFDEFKSFVASRDCVAKPRGGTLGRGVFLIRKDENQHLQKLYDYCHDNNFIVEERVCAYKEMEDFHPKSLNTIRVFTVSNDDCCEVVAAVFRMGVADNIVDNGFAGGILAPIDLNSGIVKMKGRDEKGNSYARHPDSGKAINGFVIPSWEKVVNTCKEMSKCLDMIVFAGWDVCVLPDGNIELIEVNSYPSITVLQTATKEGLKPRIRSIGEKVLGYDPIGLISVWSKSYVRYEGIYGRY